MNTTVFNLATLSVTEYTTPLTGLSGDFESTADGLFRVGGTTDAGAAISSSVTLGLDLTRSGKRRRLGGVVLYGNGLKNTSIAVADSDGKSYSYTAKQLHADVARFPVGRGIYDNYLQLTVNSRSTEAFELDRVELDEYESTNRRL